MAECNSDYLFKRIRHYTVVTSYVVVHDDVYKCKTEVKNVVMVIALSYIKIPQCHTVTSDDTDKVKG